VTAVAGGAALGCAPFSIVVLRAAVFALALLPAFPVAADTFRFSADRMSGSRATGKDVTVLSGNAEVRSEDLTLRADRIELTGKDNRYIECSGKVLGIDDKRGIKFVTERLRYDRELKIARLDGDSSLEDNENGVIAKARYIKYDDGTGVSVLQVSVRIFKGDLVCRSQYALYRRKEKSLELSGFPVVYKKDDEFRAERIRVDLDTEDVVMDGSVSGTIRQGAGDAGNAKP